MATALVPPLLLSDASDNPEHYELLGGQWVRKESVGGKDHSKMGRVLFDLLRPFAEKYNCAIDTEWSIIQEGKKVIPDVTLSLPRYTIADGYLVSPALLAVETKSSRQRLQKLIEKCLIDHHGMGTAFCWIVDIEEEIGYECHLSTGKAVVVPELTLGDCPWPIALSVKNFFDTYHRHF